MKALVSDSQPPRVRLGDAPEPDVRSDQALVEVRAVSLNRGEVKRLDGIEPGRVTGWDLAGVVLDAAADGSGPPAGARVVGIVDPYTVGGGSGAWAQRAAVLAENLAQLPDEVSFEAAATLPVAGLTALRAFEVGGFALGKRVLVTGASGGVGRFAVQIGRLAGAQVTALARRTDGLAELGADEVITELHAEGPRFDLVLDAIGGETLGTALQRVAPRGTVVSFANTVPEPVSYPTRAFFAGAPGARLYGLYLFAELAHTRTGGTDLGRLAALLGTGRLRAEVDLVRPWEQAGDAIEALMARRVAGKAVLTLG